MSDVAIRAEGLGKRYRIGAVQERYHTLRDAIVNAAKAPFRLVSRLARGGDGKDTIWALKDVSFEVKRGEVVGIIGRNGAGKTTLLKLLSRITEPTEGRAEIRGRVGSLLEVGTGFHPELTGRENIFLNGAILGMKRREIRAKFDEIVSFAEVEKFIDTPVKRYSSGMQVRLAFAVAAHLEPEILLVDEVLAVGDVAFQKKCLGKMGEVAGEGRTVVFVSHNMAAVQGLCSVGMVLEEGRALAQGPPDRMVQRYLHFLGDGGGGTPLDERRNRIGGDVLRLTGVEFVDPGSTAPLRVLTSGAPVLIRVSYRNNSQKQMEDVVLSIGFFDSLRRRLFACRSSAVGKTFRIPAGSGVAECLVPRWPLAGGRYFYNLYAEQRGAAADGVRDAGVIDVELGDYYGTGEVPALGKQVFFADFEWRDARDGTD